MDRVSRVIRFLAAFAALFVVVAIVVAIHHHAVFLALAPALLLFGTTVVTYGWPATGTVAPTVTQAMNQNSITAQVSMLNTDTVATIVHNWGAAAIAVNPNSSTEIGNWPTELFPFVIVNIDSTATTTVQPLFQVSVADTNQVVITKNTTVGTQGTFDVVLIRPHSYIK
jgi:hypothetical protein